MIPSGPIQTTPYQPQQLLGSISIGGLVVGTGSESIGSSAVESDGTGPAGGGRLYEVEGGGGIGGAT